MGFHEKTHAYLAAKYYQHLTQTFGERGKEAFVHATRYYAMQRGRRMAQRAIRDGKPLTQASYNYYGEWVPSEEMKAMDAHNQSAVQPDGALKITRCPWHAQFVEMGMEEAGREYCKVLDSAISLGFNPELGYTVEQTLHTHDCCIHRLRASSMGEGAELGKCPSGLRDFSYHCAHLYWSFQEVCTAIFAEEGQAVSQAVLADFQKDYGDAMCQTLLSFEHTNFQICYHHKEFAMDTTLNYYNQNADSFIAGTVSADMSAQYQFFLKFVPRKAKILDLGCGSGRDSAFFASLGFDVVAVDGSAELCKRAKEIYGIDAVCTLFEDLSFDEEFDAVWACASLLHVSKKDMPNILKKVSAALKPEGVLYVSFKYGNTEHVSNGRFFNDYTEIDLATLLTEDNRLTLLKYWITEDVRPDRAGEQWLNFVAIKTR